MGNYEHFNQLMLADNGGLTVEQKQFKDLHEHICYSAKKSAEHLIDMACGIREMRDSKRYKAAGFESFGDYTENALGVKERQAYNYIAVVEKLPEEFIKAHSTIGVTKLALLTSVNEEEREEILERIDIDSAKTSEINAEVKAAIEAREKAEQQLAIALEEKTGLEKENAEYQAEYSALAKEQKELRAENTKLREQISETENASQEPTVIYEPDPEQAKKLDQAEKEKHALEDELADRDRVLAQKEGEVDELRKALEAAQAAKVAPAKVEIKGDAVVIFKVKFETYQDLLEDMYKLISQMGEDDAKKCKAAVHAVFEDCGI